MKKNRDNRKMSALGRLEDQLESGTKMVKDKKVPLTEKNVKRINKEIEILKKKI